MAWATAATDQSSVAVWTQDYIHRDMLIPLAYNVPQITMCDAVPLPEKGMVLQKNILVEQTEMTALSEVTTIAENDDEGAQEITFGKRSYTMDKYGKAHPITDLAEYNTLGDLADASSRALTSVAARTLNSLFYDAIAAQKGLMWFRQDANTAAQKQGLLVDAGGSTTTIVCDELTEADDFWNNAQVMFTSGKLTGQGFAVSDFVASTDTLTVATMPIAPATGDTFNICTLGDDVSAVDKLVTTDVPTLEEILMTATRARVYGAASASQAGGLRVEYDAAGVRREISPSIASGVVFLHDFLLAELIKSMSDTAQAASQVLWQSDEGFTRLVGGGLRRMGNMLFVPVNHHKRASTTTGSLSNTAGNAWPILIMFKGCALVTTLKQNRGNRQGLVVRSKIPAANDMAILYDSIKMRNEAYVINAYGAQNGLHGAVHWASTALAA
jgi:hypothetical protein